MNLFNYIVAFIFQIIKLLLPLHLVMGLLEVLFIAVALAMDCFAISIVTGVILRNWSWTVFLKMAFMFGLFQALMPLAGWFLTNRFYSLINEFDHWVAFGVLFIIGAKMMLDSFRQDDDNHHHFNPLCFYTQILLAIATSIDALAVGISFACVGYSNLFMLISPLIIIGVVSFILGLTGNYLGIRFGRTIEKRIQPELVGGVILLIIAIKVLLTA